MAGRQRGCLRHVPRKSYGQGMTDSPSSHAAILRGLIFRLEAIAAMPAEQAIMVLGELLERDRPDSVNFVIFQARRAAARKARQDAGSGVALARRLGVTEEMVSRLTRPVRMSRRS